MSDTDFQLYGIQDARLAVHATSILPAWLWSVDGAHVLWTNAAGARVFGARDPGTLVARTFSPADQHRRQAMQLAARLTPAAPLRLERLRGFGAPLGRLLTCSCAVLAFPRGATALLIAAVEPVGRTISLDERLAHLADNVPAAAMTFTADGALAGANERAKGFVGRFNSLAGQGFDEAREGALRRGQATMRMALGRVTLHRVGNGKDIALVALIDTLFQPRQQPQQQPEDVSVPPEPAVATPPEPAATVPEPTHSELAHSEPTEPVSVAPATVEAALPPENVEPNATEPAIAPLPEPETTTSPSEIPDAGVQAAIIDHPTGEPVDKTESASDAGASEAISERPSAVQDTTVITEMESPVDTPQNVVPFPSASEPRANEGKINEPGVLALTAGESSAFEELARRLTEQLGGTWKQEAEPAAAEMHADETGVPPRETAEPVSDRPAASAVESEPRTDADTPHPYDHLPLGVIVYRLDRVLYVNRAFLDFTGHDSLQAFIAAGGLGTLHIEPESPDENAAVTVAPQASHDAPATARRFALSWDGTPGHALMFTRIEPDATVPPVAATTPAIVTPSDDTTAAEEFSTILDTIADGIVIFDHQGRLLSCNQATETLFGHSDQEIANLGLADLFGLESQRAVLGYLDDIRNARVASLIDHGREVQGRARDGKAIPLSLTLGRMRPDGTRFFAILSDRSKIKKAENDLAQAQRQVERLGSAKADLLSRISHEVRMPINAIVGFADMMIAERFGALGNERYAEYMKDIRASGQRVMTIIDDQLDLSRIEAGKMEMALVNQDLNHMIEQCVAVMQPQANRERIIIRTSLAHSLPSVKADTRALRQIAMNLIGNSIHLANAGGQVIVSTATTDFGDIVLRVRDTGPGLNDNEIAAAMAPFRSSGATDQAENNSVVNLSLTKALVEANRAQFHIKTAPHSGTLIEVVFSHASAIA